MFSLINMVFDQSKRARGPIYIIKKNKYGRSELYRDQIFSHTINL